MAVTKPDLTRIWAVNAPSGNVVDPDTTTPNKFSSGWQAEVPPFEHFNFIQNLQTQGLAHINEQGIPVWDTDTVYPVDALAKGSDGAVYIALVEQSGNDPISDTINWAESAAGRSIGNDPEEIPINGALTPSGFTQKDVAGASGVNLTLQEVSRGAIEFTGVLTGNIEVAFPSFPKQWVIINSTTGDFTLSVKTSGGTPILVPRGVVMDIRSDGTEIVQRYYREQIGRTTGGTLVPLAFNMIAGFADNYITTDVHSSVIAGGGGPNSENVIGGIVANVDNGAVSNVDPTGSILGTEARYSSIGGGYDNVLNAIASHITGAHCYIDTPSDHGTISGGSYHKINAGSYNTISGGTQHTIDATDGYSAIGGGGGSLIAATAQYSYIGGGSGHNTDSLFSTIGGGSGNSATGQSSTVAGGATNDVSQQGGVIAGGEVNTISGAGKRWGAIAGGRENSVSAEGAVISGGRGNTASADFGQASGRDAVSEKAGQEAFANQSFSTPGDAQTSRVIMKATTTGTTPANTVDLNGSSGLPSKVNTAIGYRIRVVAHRTDAQGDNAVIILEGLAHRGGSGDWNILSFTDQILTTAGVSGWSARIFNDAGTLRVEVTGEASKTIQWVAHIDWTQNTG